MLKTQTNTPKEIFLKDYTPSEFRIPKIQLHFELHEGHTIVESKLYIEPNPLCTNKKEASLFLNGEDLELESIFLNDCELTKNQYELSKTGLKILNPPQNSFQLKIKNKIFPEKNTALEGLYKSGSIYCTQNEPEGFRRITYFIDRPDNMSIYETKITADQKKYPFLLSNGNPIERKSHPDGRHSVTWQDPFPKPSYLFALVAGNLGKIEDQFITCSGRKIALEIYCDPGNEHKCSHAMESLKKSMRWDEETFGLEYDLDIYMIVAVDAFNMGAMENKGLNIFNTRCVLASAESETDREFQLIEGVIAHEYFHNWTGNRVTCRDWFQLTLKEGLTVFRDQEFSSDMTSRAVKRIEEVNNLRIRQFQEDSSPLAHPIRPESYIEINNFYTATVYDKGSEVIRMIHTLIGKENFRKGIDLYFKLYDGQAVTTENFIHAMQSASGYDLSQFTNWYHQAGTPKVKVKTQFNPDQKELILECTQTCPDTPKQKNKKPFVIPLAVGVLNSKGEDCINETPHEYYKNSKILTLTKDQETFKISPISDFKALSINRGFSAPIELELDQTYEDLSFLMAHDSDSFNRWDSGQQLCVHLIKDLVNTYKNNKNWSIPSSVFTAFHSTLKNEKLDCSFKSIALKIPSLSYLANQYKLIPLEALCDAHDFFRKVIALELKSELDLTYHTLYKTNDDQDLSYIKAGERSLKNMCLKYLLSCDESYAPIALKQYENSKNMSDRLEALDALCFYGYPEAKSALDNFYLEWKDDKLVLNKWFEAQALCKKEGTIENVVALSKHKSFDKALPNNIYSLVRTFTSNYYQFHHLSGKGYEFVADLIIELDSINPTTASVIATSFRNINFLDEKRQSLMKKELNKVLAKKDLARATYEIINKFL